MGSAFIGVSDHGGWAVFVTASADGTLIDRRRVVLVDDDLPKIPHHSEGQRLPLPQAVELVDCVLASAEHHARSALDAVASSAGGIAGVALRQCPGWLPPTTEERIRDYRAQNVADWVMYRQALAAAAAERGWTVYWYDSKDVLQQAGKALGIADFDAYFLALRKSLGPPWGNDQKLAMAAAITAAASTSRDLP